MIRAAAITSSGSMAAAQTAQVSDPRLSPERTALYEKMVRLLDAKCVWIWEGFPITCRLRYDYLENSLPHDFSFTRWKYLSIDEARRAAVKRTLRPLSPGELAGGGR